MSIEMPEATILARQIAAELPGRTVTGFELRGVASLQRMGFVDKDPDSFARLAGRSVETAVSRGNTILVKLSDHQNLVLAPEYGGEVLYHVKDDSLPPSYHLRLDLDDGSALTVRIITMGCINVRGDEELADHYMVRRDFLSGMPEPNEEGFSRDAFVEQLGGVNRQLKPVLVGKDAVLVGLSNAAFQDVIYRAGAHPKRKASELSADERGRLYDALRFVVSERLRLGGKAGFRDIYGRPGEYQPAMGPAMKGKTCPVCGSAIQKLSLGGGDVYICPACQPG
jgi:formamidopyrimidine-DNA glycosylase